MKYEHYYIIANMTLPQLQEAVNKGIEKGYTPIGGVSAYEVRCTDYGPRLRFCQAMGKPE